MKRLLLVVGDATPETVRLVLDGRPERVHVVATAVVGPLSWLANADDDAEMRAQMRAADAERALEGLTDVSSAGAGADPVDAVGRALADFPADEIIVTGSAADDGLGRALAAYGLPMYRIGPPPGRRARVNAEIRELAGGRNARSVFALVVGMNVALMAAGIVLSLLALLVLWILGLY